MRKACMQAGANALTAGTWAPAGAWGVLSVSRDNVLNAFVLALPCSSANLVETARQRAYASWIDVSSRILGQDGNHLLPVVSTSRSTSI